MMVESENTKYDSRNNCNAIIDTESNTLLYGCKNTVIPHSVTSIGDSAFYECSSLTSVTIPNSVTSIGNSAFYRCSALTSVTIPNSVTSIGNYVFYACHGLTSVTIPNSVTSIGNYAFYRCSGLSSITIPNSVTSIGKRAFGWCFGLTSMVVESENANYDSRNNCNAIIETESNTLLYGCKSTVIPNSVTSIDNYAFYRCSGLSSITIPISVTSIGGHAFDYCSNLTSVTVKWATPIVIGIDVFSNRANATLYVPTDCKASYEAADCWKDFKEIVEIGATISDNNRLYLAESTVAIGAESSIQVILENEDVYSGLEFDVTLPTGITLSQATKTNRLSSAFTLQTSSLGGNTYKVLLYNTSHQNFSGNDGALLNLVINVSETMATGDYEVLLSNIVASDADASVSDDLADSQSVLHVEDYIIGDVTSDGRVNVTDIMAVANYILKIPMTTFNEQAADVNGDSRINVTDIMGIANIILKVGNNSQAAPRRREQLLDPQ